MQLNVQDNPLKCVIKSCEVHGNINEDLNEDINENLNEYINEDINEA